ncbi:MAG TPA: hypothetical protein VHO01_09660 [Jatrophihabitans sp.]|nr:hypothetical protein [Jatrophihabitans sp.]
MAAAAGEPRSQQPGGPGRLLLALAAALALVAVVAVSTGLRTRPAHRVLTMRLAPDRPTALDPAGCPVDIACQLRAEVPAALTRAVQQAFPRARLQWRSSTESGPGQVWRITAQFLLNGDQDSLLVNAECQPDASQRIARRESSSAQQRSDLAGNQVSELAVHEVVAPGAPGCSSDLIVSAVGDGAGYDAGLQRLSADPAVQVRS